MFLMVNDFIFELGCEELPSRAVWPLASELANGIRAGLDKVQLSYAQIHCFATPRRLAVLVHELQEAQANQTVTRRGPAEAAAFDKEGNPTAALLGFATSCGVAVDQLSTLRTEKGAWMVYETVQKGGAAKTVLPQLVKQALAQLPIAKPMRWGNGDETFARPVHWVVMLYGNEVLHDKVLGVVTGRHSRGHRFHSPQEFSVISAKTYEQQLKEAFVLVDFIKRRQFIEQEINALAATYSATAIMPEALLDEVTSIVEWPQPLVAHFEKEFLTVPPEALIAAMQSHQKCFALCDKDGKLLPHFITVANIQSNNQAQVVLGNEKVMRARLSDASFFFNQDKKRPLSQHIEATKHVVFQEKLGSVYDKVQRVKQLVLYLSKPLSIDVQHVERAVELSKCDLLTGMVSEFPELQGLMGYYYALHDGEDLAVAKALDEQYMPRFSADRLPASTLGKALSLADRIDNLVGIFALGQKPSGVKDPFKLRRHALAVVRILSELPASFSLSELIEQSTHTYAHAFPAAGNVLVHELKTFILDRLNSYYLSHEFSFDLIQAVRACQDERIDDLEHRLQALRDFVALPEASSLSAACKRVGNILIKFELQDAWTTVNESLLTEGPEQRLYWCMKQLEQESTVFSQKAEYASWLKQLASIKEPVDAFFDQVMVLVDEDQIKHNRLALLARLQALLQGVADISLLQNG
jgi:glycyl-tRNA synthetase beta chain